MTIPIRFTTQDNRTPEQIAADDKVREDVERTGGARAQLTPEQRAELQARVRDKKQHAEAARARRETEQKSIEERITRLEERLARLED